MKTMAIYFIDLWRMFISPLYSGIIRCRFNPSCSEYGREAFVRHGFFKGTWLTIWRILRCNPFSKCGYDPCPK